MANNIKIVGEILNTQQVSRYDEADINLLSPQVIREDFGQQNDYIEYFIYDIGGNLLNINYSYKDFKLPNTSYIDPVNGSLPIIEIDPVKDLQILGYSSGEFKVQYNFFSNKISNPEAGLFLKEISADRTEIRVGSTTLTNEQIENAALNLINESTSSAYFIDYLINFGNNKQSVSVNIALNKAESGYEILFKLYQPLDVDIQEKDTLWVVKEKVNPYIFDINLDKLIIPTPGPQLRGPNFDIDIPNQNNLGTSYQNYNNLVNTFQGVSSSYQQLLSLITSQSIDINVDYSDYTNFVFFSSAKQRVINFYNKVKDIENYKTNISVYTPLTSSYPNLRNDLNTATSSINNIISNFDGFEYYLYFESGSTLTSSADFGITPYPKSGSAKPFNLYSTSSLSASVWFNAATSSAEYYDDYNSNILTNSIPDFIADDSNNAPYLTFLNMVGHYFDNIWIFLKAVTDINLANNNLEQGVSKDLVYYALQSLGTKLYNKYGDSSNDTFLVGKNSGSINFDNNFTPTGSYLNNIPRKDLLAELYKRIYHNLPLLLKTKGTTYGLQTLISLFGITGSILNVKEYGGDVKSTLLDEYNNNKIQIVSSSIVTGSILSPNISVLVQPTSSTLFRTNDLHYVDISFSPETQIDTYASASIVASNATWSLDDYIGNPAQLYSGSYDDLNFQRKTYYTFTGSNMDYAGFIRLIQFFDNSLFKMLKDFVPARTNLSTGITISSPVLERNKFPYGNPAFSSKIVQKEGTIDGPTISTEYNNLYYALTSSKQAYYDGNITGSLINVYSYIESASYNPYLTFNTASWNSVHPSESIDINRFLHSDFNVLFNNVSSSTLSLNRQKIEYIFGTTESIILPVELQDSYESLRSYELSRYGGVKLSSLLYNTYTSASYTGSDGSIQNGDTSYGKTAAIDKNVRKIGLFTEITSSPFLPKRNRVALKYLVDEFGNLTELNQRNKHWEEIQRTFISNERLNVSLFDNQKASNQKTTDGNKPIFDSGYSYYPIIYFSTCSSDPKLYFENLGGSNSFPLEAINGLDPKNISGSNTTTITYPLTSGSIYNIFDTTVGAQPAYYFTGSSALELFPTYSVSESGDHKARATFTLYTTMSNGGSQTWTLGLYKNNSLISVYGSSVSKTFDLTITLAATSSITYYAQYSCTYPTFDYNKTINGTDEGVIPNDILINGGPSKIPAGTRLYSYGLWKNISTPTTSSCTLSNSRRYYSTSATLQLQVYDYCRCGPPPQTGRFIYYSKGDTLYEIPDFTLNTSGKDAYTFDIDLNPIPNLSVGDKIIPKFTLDSTSTNDFTASISEGKLLISSLSNLIGYATTTCDQYFSSASISASIAAGNNNIITLGAGLSNFYSENYQFVPNPLSGSQNSLYDLYGDVDYPFYIRPYDIALAYLSDNTYVESRILDVSVANGLVQLRLDNSMAFTYRNDLMSGSYQRFLVLKRQEDETNVNLTFKKRDGQTSYGFIIPQNLAPDVLGNIDTITKEVKQKLLQDQSSVTINTY